MKVIRSVVFLSAWLCTSVLFLGYFTGQGNFLYAFVWGFVAGFALIELIQAIRIHGRKYKALQLASCANTAMVVLSLAVAGYNYYYGAKIVMLCWFLMAIANAWLVYKQRQTFKMAVEVDEKIAAHFAKYFPTGQDDDIKLERK